MTEKGFILLFEAIMEQCYKDLNDKDEKIRKDAQAYIDKMKREYAN